MAMTYELEILLCDFFRSGMWPDNVLDFALKLS